MSNEKYEITRQDALSRAFWDECPACQFLRRKGRPQNEQNATVRSCWIDFVDSAQKSGRISEKLADRATLKG